MTSHSKPHHVVVIGGGIFGVSSAVHLVRLGVEVTLVDDVAPAGGASGRSLSWLNSSRRTDTPYYRLRLAGIDRYRTLAATQPGRRLAALRRRSHLGRGRGGKRDRLDLELRAGDRLPRASA